MTAESTVRQRRRAETVGEIKQAALRQLAVVGPGALSLRGVAREVGMTVQSLYHYFDRRDALLTALVEDAHHALADAVQAAADGSRGQAPALRRRAATGAFRHWALGHRAEFLLLYGTPVPGFAPGPATGEAARRLAAPFVDVVFDGWSADELAAVPLRPGAESLATVDPTGIGLPPGALAFFIEHRSRMHGMVTLELIGHLHPLQEHAGALFEGATDRGSEQIDALQAQVREVAGQPRSDR
jgi:AcrR family transcriptional regulator